MTTTYLWLVLAGFLLGFTASTLWEWFHFRKQRLKARDARVRELEAKLRGLEEEALIPADAPPAPASAPGYRSPGVFLESEEPPVNSPAAPVISYLVAPAPQDVVLVTPETAGERRAEPRTGSRAGSRMESRPAAPDDSAPERAPSRSPSGGMWRHADTTLLSVRREALRSGGYGQTADLPARAAAQEAPAARPRASWRDDPALTRRCTDYPDNLSKVKGIGEVYRQRLYQAGIFTWHQIATTEVARLRQATGAYPSSNVEEWPAQARALAEKQRRAGAVYTGPPPDELTKIVGIGPVGAQTLYSAGICTYEQLAVTPVEELAALFPIAVAGDRPDFQRWVVQAAALADAKYMR
ncbi:MAG: hypothetical protein IT329_06180 [Caldilineaceae bacterium]|nr:hypothetical protein [Caldilineaceae bacterium]